MAITRIKNSTIGNKTPKYNDVLAGLPFRPIIGTASDGGNGTSASVAFTGNNVANGTITYTALSSPGSFTGTGTASPITVSGLTSGTAYTFQVKAGNSLGDSAYSAASNSVTPVTPSSYDSIASSSPSGVSTITFSSIPSTYQHLQIRAFVGNSTGAGALYISFNGDTTTANYNHHRLAGNGASVFASSGSPDTGVAGFYVIQPTSTYFGGCIIDIHDYKSTSKYKTIRSFEGVDKNGSGEVGLYSNLWMDTTAISSITLYMSTGNYSSGSVVSLYGIKGA